MIAVVCPLCQSQDQRQVSSRPGADGQQDLILFCPNCGSSHRFPARNPQNINNFYANRALKVEKTGFARRVSRYKTVHTRFRFILGHLESRGLKPENLCFLDIGAGLGLHVQAAREAGFLRAEGLEPQPWCLNWAKDNLGLQLIPGLATPEKLGEIIAEFPECKGITVMVSHVMEHLPDVNDFVHSLEVLKKPGHPVILFVEVPHTEMEVMQTSKGFVENLWYQHLTSFSPKGMQALLSRHGWETRRLETPQNDLRAPSRRMNLIFKARNNIVLIFAGAAYNRVINLMGSFWGGDCYIDIPKVVRIMAEA